MLAQISNYMSNGDLALTLAIMAVPFLLVAAMFRWPVVTAIVCIIAFIWFVGIPIVLVFMLAFAAGKGKQ